MSGKAHRSFSPGAVAWIVGIAAGSFALAILLTAFAGHLGDPVSSGADSFSRSALGHRGFKEFLARMGMTVVIRRSLRDIPVRPGTVWIAAEPPPYFGAFGFGESPVNRIVRDALSRDGDVLLVLPKWHGSPHPRQPRWVNEVRWFGTGRIRDSIGDAGGLLDPPPAFYRRAGRQVLDCETAWGEVVALEVQTPQFLLSPGERFEPLVTCGEDVLVARVAYPDGEAGLYLVTDPDVVNNHGLDNGGAASLVAGLLLDHLGADAAVIDETIHGYVRSSGLLAELLRFPLVLVVAQGILVLGLVLWRGMGRFGKPRSAGPALESGKEVLIDNTAKLFGVAGHTARTLPSFYWYTVRAVAADYFLPANLSRDEVIGRLRDIGNSRGVETDVGDLRDEVEELKTTRRRAPERAVRIALRLHRWQREMTDVG